MAELKIINQVSNTVTAIVATTAGPSISMDGAQTCSAHINYTASGTSAATVTFQKSNDNINWITEGTPTAITNTTTSVFLEKINPASIWMRILYTLAAGTLTATAITVTKGLN